MEDRMKNVMDELRAAQQARISEFMQKLEAMEKEYGVRVRAIVKVGLDRDSRITAGADLVITIAEENTNGH